jgi:hypothetical protein
MTVVARARAIRAIAPAVIAAAILVAACGDSASPRPTDPRRILADAVTATAAVPTLRLHVEIASNTGGLANQANQQVTIAIDADVDLATRQFAGRSTIQMPQMVVGNGGPAQQVSDIIVTQGATFNRNAGTGRWVKIPADFGGRGIGAGPTNAQIAATIANLVADPSMAVELGEAAACTLGTCDHVLARVDGRALGAALASLFGMRIHVATGTAIPSVDLDVLVDQVTSVISEVRTSITMDGSTTRILLTLSNPGQPVQIAAPPAALTDDLGMGGVILPADGVPVATPVPAAEPVPAEPESPAPIDPSAPSAP